MRQALLVDYGGVLTTSVLESFAAFCRGEGIDPAELGKVMRSMMGKPDNFFGQVERGEIDTAEFELQFAGMITEKFSLPVTAAGLKTRMFAAASTDERMLAALRAARKAGLKTGLISNSWGVTDGGYPVHMFDELFDATVISGEVKMRKPDAEIYLLTAERIQCEPEACVFVDDFKVNIEGAEAVGMAGLLHTSTDATLAALEELLGVPLA